MKPDIHDPEVLLAYVEGELTGDEAATVERALRDDGALRSLVEAMRADRAALRAWPDEEAPAGLTDDAVQHLERGSLLGDASGRERGGRRWRIGPTLVYSGLAAALALAAALYVQTTGGNRSPDRLERTYDVAEAERAEPRQFDPERRRADGAGAVDDYGDRAGEEDVDQAAPAPSEVAPTPDAEALAEGSRSQRVGADDVDDGLGATLSRSAEPAAAATAAPAAEAPAPPADEAADRPLQPAEDAAPASPTLGTSDPARVGDEVSKAAAVLQEPAAGPSPQRFDLSTLLGPLPWKANVAPAAELRGLRVTPPTTQPAR